MGQHRLRRLAVAFPFRHRAQDVIFDGTMMWAPFVEQTIAMVRDHRHKYRRGPGYHKSDGCNVERRAYPGLRASSALSTDQRWADWRFSSMAARGGSLVSLVCLAAR